MNAADAPARAQDEEPGEVVGVDEAALIAGRHVSTMRRMYAVGEGPPVYRRGRRYVYRRAEVEAWRDRVDALVPVGGGDCA